MQAANAKIPRITTFPEIWRGVFVSGAVVTSFSQVFADKLLRMFDGLGFLVLEINIAGSVDKEQTGKWLLGVGIVPPPILMNGETEIGQQRIGELIALIDAFAVLFDHFRRADILLR